MIQTIILSNGLRYALLNAKLSAHKPKNACNFERIWLWVFYSWGRLSTKIFCLPRPQTCRSDRWHDFL